MIKHLTGLDAFFLHGETAKQAMNLTGIGCYDPSTNPAGKVKFTDILDYAKDRTQQSALFRRRLAFLPFGVDHPYWVEDTEFDVKNHVFHVSLPAPGNRAQLNQELARIHALMIDRAHPLWEWWYIDGLNEVEGVAPGSFALAFKLHHAAFDGVSAWEVINISHDKSPPAPGAKATRGNGASHQAAVVPPPSLAKIASHTYMRALAKPAQFMNTWWGNTKMVTEAMQRQFKHFPLAGGKVPDTQFNRPLSGARVHGRIQITLDELKTLRTGHKGSTVNDAVLGIIGGGLRDYLKHHGLLPEIPLVVGVPISTREEGRKEDAGNEALLSVLPLGTDIADHVERLKSISEWTTAKKDYVKTVPAQRMVEWMDFIPGPAMALAVTAFTTLKVADLATMPFNLIVTNVPASKTPIYFAQSKMVDYDGSGPIWDGAAMIHVITSYLGVVNISFDADGKHLPDPEVYCAYLERAKQQFLAATAPPVQAPPVRMAPAAVPSVA